MTTTEPTTAAPPMAAEIEDLFCQGHPIDHVVATGETDGWSRDDVLAVLRDRQWDLDASGRLPRSKRVTLPRGLRDRPAAAPPRPAAPRRPALPPDWPSVDEEEAELAAAEERLTVAGALLLQEAKASVALDGETQVIGGAYTADAPRDSTPTASSAYVAVLRGRELGVDHSYQRPLDEVRVRRMAREWEPRLVGVLDVADRGEGVVPRYAVINGQHRAAAAARVSPDGPDVSLACNVHEGLTVADEARLMHELDRTTKKLTGWDKWHSRRAAGDALVLKVEEIAARHGLRVDPNPVDGCLRSYGAAEKLLARGGDELLDSALAVLHGAYGLSFSAYQAPLLSGIGQLLQTHGKDVDIERLTRALAATRPEQLRATASAYRDIDGGQLHELMTRAVVGQYNRTSGSGPKLAGGRA